MATKVMMEALSPTMEEGRLVKWNKNEGDAVKSGDVLAEVETDKAVMELVARGDGVLRKRLINEGDTAPVGQLIGVIGGADENVDAMVGGGGGGGGAPAAKAPERDAPAPAEKVIAEAREGTGRSSAPRTPSESQGEASMPPQEKQGDTGAAPAGQRAPAPRGGDQGAQ